MNMIDIANSKIMLTKYVISAIATTSTRYIKKLFCFCFDLIIITLLLNFSSSEVQYFADCLDYANYRVHE